MIFSYNKSNTIFFYVKYFVLCIFLFCIFQPLAFAQLKHSNHIKYVTVRQLQKFEELQQLPCSLMTRIGLDDPKRYLNFHKLLGFDKFNNIYVYD
jgi:hypothetical protein